MGTTITRSVDATSIVPTLVLDEWSSDNEPGTIVHEILGREDDPDFTLRPASARRGTIRLLFWDHTTAEAARAFHTVPAVFTASSDIPWIPATYVVAGGPVRLRQTTENRRRWIVEVPYIEVSS